MVWALQTSPPQLPAPPALGFMCCPVEPHPRLCLTLSPSFAWNSLSSPSFQPPESTLTGLCGFWLLHVGLTEHLGVHFCHVLVWWSCSLFTGPEITERALWMVPLVSEKTSLRGAHSHAAGAEPCPARPALRSCLLAEHLSRDAGCCCSVASVPWCSAFFMVQFSCPYMATG